MNADELLNAGRIDESLARLKDDVRNKPADAATRMFLFRLMSVNGDWDRALAQLNVAAELDDTFRLVAAVFRQVLQSEGLRAEIFAGRRSAVVFGEPEAWMAHLTEALRHTAEGRHEQAAESRALAFDAAPATAGTLVDKDGGEHPFEWLADADPRLGPMLEAIVNGSYYWIPVHRVAAIQLEPPQDLGDLIWAPAIFQWSNGGEATGFIPVRYPGSEKSDNDRIRLSRLTDWETLADGTQLGIGQRLFATDEGDFPLLDTRQITFAVESAPGTDDAAAAVGEPGVTGAEVTSQDRLPPLLDRLVDDKPSQKTEGSGSRSLTTRQYLESVLRDLTWLLNTGNLEGAQDIDEYPHVRSTVLNYGLPDLAGLTEQTFNAHQVADLIRQAIINFEPRISPDSLQVRPAFGEETSRPNMLTFEITGELQTHPLPEHLFVKTEVDLESGDFAIKDTRRG